MNDSFVKELQDQIRQVHADLKPGQVYVLTIPCAAPAHHFPAGSELTLVEPTGHAPFGFQDPLGPNWIASSPVNGATVWSSIPYAIAKGWLVLKS